MHFEDWYRENPLAWHPGRGSTEGQYRELARSVLAALDDFSEEEFMAHLREAAKLDFIGPPSKLGINYAEAAFARVRRQYSSLT